MLICIYPETHLRGIYSQPATHVVSASPTIQGQYTALHFEEGVTATLL